MLPLTTFYRSGAPRSDVYKWDAFVTSWRFYNRAWQPQRHDRPPETSGTLWIHRGALTNQRCSLATGCGIRAKITKFAPNMHPGMLSAGIENGGHWPWTSRSFWPFWLRIIGNSACPCHDSSYIWTTITQFAPNMHSGIISAGIESGGNWPWPSRLFWPFWLRILVISACPHNNF